MYASPFFLTTTAGDTLGNLPLRWSSGNVDLPDYEILRFVGAGAMGAVFEARDRRSGQQVAIKTLLNRDAASLVGLKREFRTMADLVHPNLALSHELAFDDDVPYLVMQFVDGVDFLSYVRGEAWSHSMPVSAEQTLVCAESFGPGGEPSCDPERLREALHQLVLGVDALHGAGLLHLDLKPANVMVEASGRVVVLDFGLVDLQSKSPQDSPLLLRGTPAYMAPEQCAGETGRAADLYAIGVMLFEALTGGLPFEIASLSDLRRKQREDAPRVDSLVAGLPPDLTSLCDDLLKRGPDLRPSAEQVLTRLARTPGSMLVPKSAPPSERPFVGRETELAELLRAYDDVVSTGPVQVYVDGASGIGKTTLVRRFLAHVREGGALVLESRCYERESVPYKAIDGIVDSMAFHVREFIDELEELPALLRVFPALRGESQLAPFEPQLVDPHELRQSAFNGLRKLFRRLARNHKVALAIDDLHWGDLDSARLLREIFASGNPPPVLVVGTYRSEELSRSPCLAELLKENRGADVRRIALGPLAEAQARDLALLLLDPDGGQDESLASHVAKESGGSPLFVDSLLRYHSLPRSTAKSASLREVVCGLLDDLEDDGRTLVTLLAVAGEPLPQSVALDAAHVAADRRAIFAKLRSLRLVRTGGAREADAAEIYHDRIRQSICSGLTGAELSILHGVLASALERGGCSEPERLAHHYHAAGNLQNAGRYALLSAERASAMLAFERAASLFGLAVECQPDDVELRKLYAEALERAGRCADAAQQFLACARGVSEPAASEFERSAARQLLLAGRIEDGLGLLRPHLRRLQLDLPSTPSGVKWSIATNLLRLQVRGVEFQLVSQEGVDPLLLARIDAGISTVDGLTGGDPMTAASLMLQTFLLALRAGEPSRVAWGLAQYGLLRSSNGKEKAVAAGGELLAKAEYLSREVADPVLDGKLLVARARAALTIGAFGQALTVADVCTRHFREKWIKSAGLVTVAQNVALFALEATGLLKELEQRAQARLQFAESVGDLYSQATARTYAAVSALARDDADGCASLLERLGPRWPASGSFLFQSWLLLKAQTLLDLYRRKPAEAWVRLEQYWPLLERSQLMRAQFLGIFARRLRGVAAVAALAQGQGDSARLIRSALADADGLERQARPYARAGAAAIRGGVAAFRLESPSAVLEYTRAAAGYEQAGMPVEAACCRLRRGMLSDMSLTEAEQARLVLRAAGVEAPDRYVVLHAP